MAELIKTGILLVYFVCLLDSLSVCLFVYLFVCLSVCLVCLFVHRQSAEYIQNVVAGSASDLNSAANKYLAIGVY